MPLFLGDFNVHDTLRWIITIIKFVFRFRLHEVAYYDLPVIIDYILNLTNHTSLYFLGHSIGSTVGMILCALRPEYNSKIRLHLALAPLVYVAHAITVPQRFILLPSVPMVVSTLKLTTTLYKYHSK